MNEIETLNDMTAVSTGVVIYFYNTNCSSCRVLRPKVKLMINKSFPEIKFYEINVEDYPGLAAEAAVFSSPTIVTFFEGKETIRESRYISVSQLQEKIERYYNMIF